MNRLMFRIAIAGYVVIIFLIIFGSINVVNTLKSIKTEMPINTLEQHNKISSLIDSLGRLNNSVNLLKDKNNESVREEVSLNLDICFNLYKSFQKNIPSLNENEYRIAGIEVKNSLDRLDEYLNSDKPLKELEIKSLYTRLDESMIALNSTYLDANRKVTNLLILKTKQMEVLRLITNIVFILITIFLLIIGILLIIQHRTIRLVNESKEKLVMNEKELIKARLEAESASMAKSGFLANMSHEIRTPMNAIIGFNNLLERTKITKKQSDYINKIKSASNTLLSTINDILDFSKIESGKVELENIEFNIDELIENIVNVIRDKAAEKGIEVIIDVDKDVSKYLIGDPLRLGQVLLNLLNNAIKFTEKGEVILRIIEKNREFEEIIIEFSVLDTGIGLTDGQKINIFTPFSQADISTTRIYGGTGLGLSICKRLVNLMGGNIIVESEFGKGSKFIFTAKLKKREFKDENKRYIIPGKISNIKVMVVDDNDLAREVIGGYLEQFGVIWRAFARGSEIIDVLEKERYDLILMDWNMPEKNGIEVWKEIKENRAILEKPKIILITAYSREDVLFSAEREQIDDVLIKPINESVLYNCLLNLFINENSEEYRADKSKIQYPEGFDNIRGALIVVVEDNEINQSLIKELLEQEGFRVIIVDNGIDCIELVKKMEDNIQLILMDIQMPGLDGYRTTEIVRKESKNSDLRIIALTADALTDTFQKVLDSGMNDYVTKPIDVEFLFEKMVKWVKPLENSKKIKIEKMEEDTIEIEVQEIEGLNIKDGIRRMAGNKRLYVELLEKYTNNSLLEKFKQSMKDNKLEDGYRAIHTFKGISGNIGAEKIFKISADIEKWLKDGRRIEEIEQTINNLEKEVAVLKININKLLGNIRINLKNKQGFSNNIKEFFEKLLRYLEEDDFESKKFFVENRGMYNLENIGDIDDLEKCIDTYDFETAKNILTKIMENYL